MSTKNTWTRVRSLSARSRKYKMNQGRLNKQQVINLIESKPWRPIIETTLFVTTIDTCRVKISRYGMSRWYTINKISDVPLVVSIQENNLSMTNIRVRSDFGDNTEMVYLPINEGYSGEQLCKIATEKYPEISPYKAINADAVYSVLTMFIFRKHRGKIPLLKDLLDIVDGYLSNGDYSILQNVWHG